MILLPEATALLRTLRSVFTQPTAKRFLILLVSAILTTGRRTIANLLRTLRHLAPGHRTSYQRVLSTARWSGLQLAAVLTRFLIRHWLPTGTIHLVGDDTVEAHPGAKVYGKARHRDPVRSTHTYTVWHYGHRWVVLAVLIRFPFATRPWALPVLVGLYQSAELNQARHRPHRTPPQIMCCLLRQMLLWFPARWFVFVGDGNYGTHEVARFCQRHAPRLTLVSKFYLDANLFEPPPPYNGKGRPRVKGAALPKPYEVVAQTRRRTRMTVGWYGGQTRQVETVCRSAHWYKSGHGLVALRWVFVMDCTGTHREEYFFTTDTHRDPKWLISTYTARWNIETTFQEMRSQLGWATTRGWCQQTIERASPCLFGLYTVVAVLYAGLPESKRQGSIDWPGKVGVTFGDAVRTVRRWWWAEWVFPQAFPNGGMQKLPADLQDFLLDSLAPAA
jgi:DDE superfamily endonuclease